jgi:hypothetical protein
MASPVGTVAIVATGPSVLKHQDITADIIIAVNGAIKLVTPHIWFTVDPSPLNLYLIQRPVPGVEYICGWDQKHEGRVFLPYYVKKVARKNVSAHVGGPILSSQKHIMAKVTGLSEDPGTVNSGNSAFGALNWAYHMRPEEIHLYGVDGTQEDRATGGKPGKLRHLPDLFESAVLQLKKAGIRVINMNPESRVRCFEFPATV